MNPLRTQVKFFLDSQTPVDLSIFSNVFQRWIQQKALEGQLVDVADYRHVHNGPGILLIGHDSDYTIETRDGRLGLLYTRKRQVDADLASQLRASVRLALTACRLLEAEAAFQPRLKFRADEIEFRFADRLQLPNKPESFELVRDDLRAVLEDLYGDDGVIIRPVQHDPRYLLTVTAKNSGATSLSMLASLAQLSGAH